MKKNKHYIAKTGAEAASRLSLQHEVFKPGTETLLEMSDFHQNMNVLVIGSGAGDETFLIANKLNNMGHVTGIDINPEQTMQSKNAITPILSNRVTFDT